MNDELLERLRNLQLAAKMLTENKNEEMRAMEVEFDKLSLSVEDVMKELEKVTTTVREVLIAKEDELRRLRENSEHDLLYKVLQKMGDERSLILESNKDGTLWNVRILTKSGVLGPRWYGRSLLKALSHMESELLGDCCKWCGYKVTVAGSVDYGRLCGSCYDLLVVGRM